jgi:hypothetical protein
MKWPIAATARAFVAGLDQSTPIELDTAFSRIHVR